MDKTFSKIWIIIAFLVLMVGGFFAWQYFSMQKEEIKTLKEVTEEILKDDITDWQTYRNEEYGLRFQYPLDWEIIQDIVYETAAGIKAKTRWINLQKIGEGNSAEWIRINPRQFQTSEGKCYEGNLICTYSKDEKVLDILRKIFSTIQFVEKK